MVTWLAILKQLHGQFQGRAQGSARIFHKINMLVHNICLKANPEAL